MSLAEIKEQIAQLTADERLELAALIVHLNRSDDPRYQAELDKRMSAMDAGKKISQEELQQFHQDMAAHGQ